MTIDMNQESIRLAECFLSIQGEGPSLGAPAHFVRLQGCTVGCHWCDSKYTWQPGEGLDISVDDLGIRLAELGNASLLVLTGGEPLESDSFQGLVAWAAPRWPRVEVETSGIRCPPTVPANVWWNWSPKLSTVTPRSDETWRHARAFLESERFACKVVVAQDEEWAELQTRVADAGVPPEHVWVMPEGMKVGTLEERAKWLAPRCIEAGYRLTMRLHIHLWGARRGV